MPDAWQVEQMFVDQIGSFLYTAGGYQPLTVATSDVLNQPFRLYRGWPVDNPLVNDLLAGVTNVSVFSMPGQRNTTRFLRQMMNQVAQVPEPTMLASLNGNTITFSGTTSISELISVSVAHDAGMAIRLTANDTPQSVAQTFASGLPNATASNGVLTLNTQKQIGVVLGMDVTMLREVHRQCGIWKVTIWAPNPQLRDQFCSLIDPSLQNLDRFFFADGSCSGPIVGAGFLVDDVPEKQHLWKRDLHYEVEYPTDYQSIVPVMTLGEVVNERFVGFTMPPLPPTDVAVQPIIPDTMVITWEP